MKPYRKTPLTLLEIRRIARRQYRDHALQRKLVRALVAQRGRLLIDGGPSPYARSVLR